MIGASNIRTSAALPVELAVLTCTRATLGFARVRNVLHLSGS